MTTNEPEPESDAPRTVIKDLPGLAAFATLGVTIAVSVTVGLVAGIWADSGWHVAPWGLLIGLGLGVALAVQSVVTLVRRWL